MKEALLYEKIEGLSAHCFLCNHHCKIKNSEFGFCGVRENKEGKLFTHTYGEAVAANIDPVEKNPCIIFFREQGHFLLLHRDATSIAVFVRTGRYHRFPFRRATV